MQRANGLTLEFSWRVFSTSRVRSIACESSLQRSNWLTFFTFFARFFVRFLSLEGGQRSFFFPRVLRKNPKLDVLLVLLRNRDRKISLKSSFVAPSHTHTHTRIPFVNIYKYIYIERERDYQYRDNDDDFFCCCCSVRDGDEERDAQQQQDDDKNAKKRYIHRYEKKCCSARDATIRTRKKRNEY